MSITTLIILFCMGLIPYTATEKRNSFQIQLLGWWAWGFPIGMVLSIFLKDTLIIILQAVSMLPFMICLFYIVMGFLMPHTKDNKGARINQFFWISIINIFFILAVEIGQAVGFLQTHQPDEIKTYLIHLMIKIISYNLVILCLIKHHRAEFKKLNL